MAAFDHLNLLAVLACFFLYALQLGNTQSPTDDPPVPAVSQAAELDDSILQTSATETQLLSAPSTVKEVAAMSIGGTFLYCSFAMCIVLCVRKNLQHIKHHLSISKRLKLQNDDSNLKDKEKKPKHKKAKIDHKMSPFRTEELEESEHDEEAQYAQDDDKDEEEEEEVEDEEQGMMAKTKEDALITELKARQLQNKHKVNDNFIIQINQRAPTEQASPEDDGHEVVPAPPPPPVESPKQEIQHHAHILTTSGF